MKAGWQLTHCEHYGFTSVAPPWQSCHTSPFSESWFPFWALISLRCHVFVHIPVWQSGTQDARRHLYYPCRSTRARALPSLHSTRGGGGERGRGLGVRLTRLEATLESRQRRMLENRLIEKWERRETRDVQNETAEAQIVCGLRVRSGSRTRFFPGQQTRNVEAARENRRRRCEKLNLNFLLFKIRKLNFNDPCGGISLAQQQMQWDSTAKERLHRTH